MGRQQGAESAPQSLTSEQQFIPLVQQCVVGKKSGIFFTREGGRPVRDFRGTRAKVCYALLFAMCCAGAFPSASR
jgi:hypothetical protein